MPIADFIQVSTRFASPPLGIPSLTIPLGAAILTTPQDAAWDAEFGASVDVVEINGANFQDTLDTLGVTAGEDLDSALSDLFSQRVNGQPAQPDVVLLARRSTPVVQVNTVTVDAFEAGTYTVTINGTDFAVPGNTDEATTGDDIRTAIAAGSEPVTGGGAGATVTVTANEAGVPFTISVTHSVTPANISQVSTTPNNGIGEDIPNWISQDDRWYFLLETSRSSGVIQTAAETVESLIKNRIFMAQTSDALAQTGASTADLASVLGSAGLGLTRTALVWHDNDDEFVDWALVGKLGAFSPGVPNPVHQPLASVTGISAPVLTSSATLETKRYTFLESYQSPIPPVSSTRGGKMLDGNWIDIIWGVDAVNLTVEIRVYEALRGNNVPYRGGEGSVEGAIRGALSEFEGAAGEAFLVEGASSVQVPDAGTQSDPNRTSRLYDGVTWGALAQGKVNAINITGFLEQ